MPSIDWKKEASGSFQTYPNGTYKVQISSWEERAAKNGTPQILWKATIRDAADKNLVGLPISCFTPLTSNALFRIANLVQACGVDLSECGKMAIGSDAFKAVLDSAIHKTTYWQVIIDPEYKNNKVEQFIRDEKQETSAPKAVTDPACPF